MDFVCLDCIEEVYDLEMGDPCPICKADRLFPITYVDNLSAIDMYLEEGK